MPPSHRLRPETGKPGACAWLSLDRLAGRLLLAGHAGVAFAHPLERGAHGIHEHLEHLGHGGELGRIRRRRLVADAVGEVLVLLDLLLHQDWQSTSLNSSKSCACSMPSYA